MVYNTREKIPEEPDDEFLDMMEQNDDDDEEDQSNTSIYIEPYNEEDEWKKTSEKHNKELNQRWKNKLNRGRIKNDKITDVKEQDEQPEDILQSLEDIGRPVIPIILRANYVGTFDTILDGIELLQDEFNVRIQLIHGGIGPIIPNDIIQAEIGNKFTYCPIYAFQVPIHHDAKKHAIINKIIIKQYNHYTDLLNDIKSRCNHIIKKTQ